MATSTIIAIACRKPKTLLDHFMGKGCILGDSFFRDLNDRIISEVNAYRGLM